MQKIPAGAAKQSLQIPQELGEEKITAAPLGSMGAKLPHAPAAV